MNCSENNMVIGLQWGNEGKGRVIDFLSNRSDVVVRFQGCSNGGRTVVVCGESFRINCLPSGIQHEHKKCVICGGVTLDLEKISDEIAMVKEAGILKAQLTISPSCHLILDYHKKLDVLDGRIFGHDYNRTMNEPGYGHCCADKYRRTGIRVIDLLSPNVLLEKIEQNLLIKNECFSKIYGEKPISPRELYEKCILLGEIITPYIGDTAEIIENAVSRNIGILFESCDGTLNDVDRGTYPFVMPISSISAAALCGTGMRWNSPMRIIGVTKPYCTRSDRGPFITEEFSSVTPFLRNRGKEFSDTSGEPRRIGWLDMPALKYSLRENGAHVLAINKLDVLTGVDEIKVCTSYLVNCKERKKLDLTPEEMEKAKPIYKIFEGWKEELSGCNEPNALPQQARAYIDFIEEETGIPVVWIGVGAEWGNALFRRT